MSTKSDPYNLKRFVDAQAPVYEQVCAELRRGRKTSHWIWFIFPQIEGLGKSWTSQRYAISSLAEARAYLDHPILGPRLIECTNLVLNKNDRTIGEILGADDVKFHSSMTLFARAASDSAVFDEAIRRFFGGKQDPLTLARV